MKKWYVVRVYRAHRGSGRMDSTLAYIYAESVTKVLDRYRTMPGIKRNIGMKTFPDVTLVSLEKSKNLEEKIIQEARIPLDKAKRTWYYAELI